MKTKDALFMIAMLSCVVFGYIGWVTNLPFDRRVLATVALILGFMFFSDD